MLAEVFTKEDHPSQHMIRHYNTNCPKCGRPYLGPVQPREPHRFNELMGALQLLGLAIVGFVIEAYLAR